MKMSAVGLSLALALATLAGCSDAGADDASDCRTAPDSLINAIMSTARTDFMLDKSRITRVEFAAAKISDLGADDASLGFSRIVALNVGLRQYNTSWVEGAYQTVTFAASSDGQLIAPLDREAAIVFDIAPPQDPAWAEVASRLADSTVAVHTWSCADEFRPEL